ncbi:HAMP domain-containing sensor histidine kinase [uncultured Leifsonia sp.]|uniref:sensor histidine kinase n=1 Tax=Leifsonia sp. TaxID=1870902 RepID=UPI0028D523A8|nr:HAMP domain-containing sensor histidine kinase [uncultured Leifsonia sp.]
MSAGRADRELRSASVRLAIQFGVLILVLFAVLGGVVYAIVAGSQAEAARRAVEDTSRIDSPHDAPPGMFVTITGDRGTMSSPDIPDGLPVEEAFAAVRANGQPDERTVTADGRDYLVRTTEQGDHWIQVAYPLREQQEELARLATALIVSGVIAALAAAGIGVLMARRAMRPLADALRMQRRFVADAGHELRTPLTLLSTRAQLVRRRLTEEDDPAVVAGVGEIVDDSRALTEIVADLLLAADPRETAARERVDLAGLAAAAVRSVAPKSEERGLRVDLDAPEPVVVSGAPVSLRRLIIALLDNATDHAASAVEVRVQRAGRHARLVVADDGPGFPQDDPDTAFERFASARSDEAQTAPSASRHYGLGLALVAEVAARHGGAVHAENVGPDGGASVTVELPIADS